MKKYVKSNDLHSEDGTDNDLLFELFDTLDVDYDRNGTPTEIYIQDYDDFVDWYGEDFDVSKEEFDATKSYLEDLVTNARFYSERFGDTYLQLSDNHTLFDIDNKDLTEDYYSDLVEDAVNIFESRTGEKLYGLGRSCRHICIEFTLDNLINYNKYADLIRDLELEVIDEANAYSLEDYE